MELKHFKNFQAFSNRVIKKITNSYSSTSSSPAHLVALRVPVVKLFCPGLALHHWVHCFQVRWIGNDGQADILVGHTVQSLDICSQMIFHVPRPLWEENSHSHECHAYFLYVYVNCEVTEYARKNIPRWYRDVHKTVEDNRLESFHTVSSKSHTKLA